MVGAEDAVDQTDGDLSAFEGDGVTIACSNKTSANTPSLLWYKQKANGFPEFMLIRNTYSAEGTTEEMFKERFQSKVNTASKTVPLTIQNLQVSDSAVYYCALRPTVTAVCEVIIQKPAEKTYSYVHSNT